MVTDRNGNPLFTESGGQLSIRNQVPATGGNPAPTSLSVAAELAAVTVPPPEYVEGELVVKFADGPLSRQADQCNARVGAEVVRVFPTCGWQHVRLPSGMTVQQPIVVTQPIAQTAGEGATVTFMVEATGTAPLRYQWQTSLNGTCYTDILNATNATLEIIAGLPAYQYYRVEVSDSGGAVLSATARLSVITLPIITRQPASLTVALGETITLRVEAQSARGC